MNILEMHLVAWSFKSKQIHWAGQGTNDRGKNDDAADDSKNSDTRG